MDDIAKYNKERWEELAQANVEYSRPFLDLDPRSAREVVDPEGMMGEVAGKDVLCLAGGGGQQSVAFALLGANVTVLDLSETQLNRDQEAAAHYHVNIETFQGDMRDLSRFETAAFDIVWHAHSLNFVPDARTVFREVARVLRVDGLYCLHCHNPFTHGVDDEQWDESGYRLKYPYTDGEIDLDNPYWDFEGGDGTRKRIKGPREFRHTLSTLLNSLIERGFVILAAWEETGDEPDPEPGTWGHFMAVTAPFLIFWASYRPYISATG
ncbi:MAG: class I SAM-dependent methyltransferase [Candidatus Bipolaricaulia bacterium]